MGRAAIAFPASSNRVSRHNPRQANSLQFTLDNQYQYVILSVSIGTRILSVLLQVMRLRRAVPKIPVKSSVLPRLPLHKNRSLRTRSESTLPQPLIPLHFKSFISNVYKKPGGGASHSRFKVLQLVTPLLPSLRTRRNIRNSNLFTSLLHNSRTPRGWGYFARSRPYLITSFSLLLCFRLLSHSNKSGCSRVIRSHIGWNWNQPASGMPTCECVSLAVS
jgi:hypothetical protein